jgi:16S rRNA (guanine527-N7)-methyltransferase
VVHIQDDARHALLERYERLLLEKNAVVNLIARTTDPAEVRVRHIEHSLYIARRAFPAGARVVDFGTGGGLPGIPLAILFPDTEFFLVDSTRKKIQAVTEMVDALGLENVHAWWGRAEEWDGKAHYAVSRATASLADLWRWYSRVRVAWTEPDTGAWEPGLVCLKGGDLREEISRVARQRPDLRVVIEPIDQSAKGEIFEGKVLVHVTPG